MKAANVVSVRDVTPPTEESNEDTGKAPRLRVAKLLRTYPSTSIAENTDILRFLASASHLEIGLLTTEDSIRPALAQFRQDHRKNFAIKPGEALLFLLCTLGPIAAIAYGYMA